LPETDAPHGGGGGTVVPLRCPTIDDGEIKLGPVQVEPLTAAQEAEAVELLGRLFAASARRRAESKTRLRRVA